MSGSNGRRTAKRTRHDQPPPMHQQPPNHPPIHPAYYPPPPGAAYGHPSAGAMPPMPPYPWMVPLGPHGMPAMPPPHGGPPPQGYGAAAEPTTLEAAPTQTPARPAAARRVSPTNNDGNYRRNSLDATDDSSRHASDNSASSSGNRSATARTCTSTTTTPVPVHLRAAYRTQTHTCRTCYIASPSSTFVTHPGPQHYPTCPKHRPITSSSAAHQSGRSNNSYAKIQAALTREYRDVKRRIEDQVQRQRVEFLAQLEMSKTRQLEEALGAYRQANDALGRVPVGMPMPPMPVPMMRMPPAYFPMEPMRAAVAQPAQRIQVPDPEEDEGLPPPLPFPEEEFIEPLPAEMTVPHAPDPTNADNPAIPTTEPVVDPATAEDGAFEAVDELIAEAGLDGDELGLGGAAPTTQALQEGAEPLCVQHLVRSKRRGSASSGGSGRRGGSAAESIADDNAILADAADMSVQMGAAAPAQSPDRPPAAAPAAAAATIFPANAAAPGPKCSQCKSPLDGGPPAAMCTSDKCRTMLCGPCLEEHKATAPDNSWCSDCGRVVNIVCRTCLQTKGSASTSIVGKTKLGSNEFLRCRAANCEQYCCPSHIRMMDCTVCGRQPFCHGTTRKCATVQCDGCDGDDCDRQLCGQMLCALKEGCICGKRRDDPNVDWAVTIMGEARKQDKVRSEPVAAEENPVETSGTGRKGCAKREGKRKKKAAAKLPTAKHDADDELHANIHEIHEILAGGDNEMAAI